MDHATSINTPYILSTFREEIERCPFCRNIRPYVKGNTPHLHIKCDNINLQCTRFEAAQALNDALQPAFLLLKLAPGPINPKSLCNIIQASLTNLNMEPITTPETFNAPTPKIIPPTQRRVVSAAYWERARQSRRHPLHRIATCLPVTASIGLIPPACIPLD